MRQTEGALPWIATAHSEDGERLVGVGASSRYAAIKRFFRDKPNKIVERTPSPPISRWPQGEEGWYIGSMEEYDGALHLIGPYPTQKEARGQL